MLRAVASSSAAASPTYAGLNLAIATKTGAYTMTASDYTILADATAGAFTVTLPASPARGMLVNVKKIDATANTVTISGNGKNIDGTATRAISSQFTNSALQYDGAAWWML